MPQRLKGTKKHEGFAAEKRGKGGGAEMIFWRGRICIYLQVVFRHEGSKKHEGFAAEKRGKGDYAEIVFLEGNVSFY